VVDGTCLEVILGNQELVVSFFKVAMRAPGLCVCRCTPTQKTEMTKLLKKYSGQKIIAAVGDGDNDAGMLNEADLGITVSDKNDLQTYSSDFSIRKFAHLRKLILWHGR
jgi:phospholipid-translocating ATPase